VTAQDSLFAHGIGEAADLPLPLDLVLQAGAVTVVVSFVAVATLRQTPRTPAVRRLPSAWTSVLAAAWWRLPARAAVLGLALYIVGNALFGPGDETNPAAHALFVWLWVGVVALSVLFGPVWRVLNPLRTVHTVLYQVLRLPISGVRPAAVRAGQSPAAVALLAFVWFELVAPDRTDPRVVGLWLCAYATIQLGMAILRGEQWFDRGDGFEVYSTLAGRLSTVATDSTGRLVVRSPLAGLSTGETPPGTLGFVAVWWGSTLFDSAAGSPWWIGTLQASAAPVLVSTLGLVATCVVVAASLRWAARRVDIALPLVPIAAGYTLAHYASLLVVEAPRGMLLVVQQWGLARSVAFSFVPPPAAVAVFQVACIVVGHLAGVLAAHDRALRSAAGKSRLLVVADELPSVLLMVGYTWAGLFLLFAA
jgi:hypothetical protein